MSYHGMHMVNTVNGIRGKNNRVVPYSTAYSGLSWENFLDVYYDGMGWDVQLTGNTKFVDSHIWVAFLKCFFNRHRAMRLIGFTVTERLGTLVIDQRLKRINTKSFLKLSESAIDAGLVDGETIRGILMMNVPYKKNGAAMMYRSKIYRYFAKRLVTEALAYATVVPGGPTKTRQAATRLNVPLDTVRYWRDLETPNVMVYPPSE